MTLSTVFKSIFLLFLIILYSCLTYAKNANKLPHNVIECSIFNNSGELLWDLNNAWCAFFSDGSLVAASRNEVRYLNKNMSVEWTKKTPIHHQLNLSENKSEILVMTTEYHRFRNKMVAFDRLEVLDRQGKLIKYFSFYENRSALLDLVKAQKDVPLWAVDEKRRRRKDVAWEFSHANSFYEMGPNKASIKNKVFNAGNYLVNSNLLNLILVLDKDLKKILWSVEHSQPVGGENNLHDVQMQTNGKFLVYANRGTVKKYSTIDEIDPLTLEQKVIYKENPPERFFATVCGGVQRINTNQLLISDVTNGPWSYLIDLSQKGKKVWSFQYKFKQKAKNGTIQQIKRYDLSEFLKHHDH